MIRPALLSDLQELLRIYAAARCFMAENGNPTQWASHYPDETLLRQDIADRRLFLLEDGRPYGCFMLCEGPDPTYQEIFGGSWGWDTPYGVLHRVAGDGSKRGILHQCVCFAAQRFSHLRIDTHEHNLPMQKAIQKEGFTQRGTIFADDGTPRLAYDRHL